MKRRRFIQTVGLTGAAILASPGRTIAGPFKPGDFSGSQVPVDKKLDPAWVRSLRERGTPTTYLKSKAELRYIGMPVGGICAGTMYLGGDGRLWLWDIFKSNYTRESVAGMKFDLVALNPPVRAGKRAVLSLIGQAQAALRPGGRFYLVALTRLGAKTLAKAMKETFGRVAEIRKGGGYRVYLASPQAPAETV